MPYYNAVYKTAAMARGDMLLEESVAAEAVSDEAIPFLKVEENKDPVIREDFAATMAWEPFLFCSSLPGAQILSCFLSSFSFILPSYMEIFPALLGI